MATHFSILVWRIPWTELPGRLSSTASQRVGYNWATNTFTFININAVIPLCTYSIPFTKLLTTQTLLSSQIFLYIACIIFWIVHSRKESFSFFFFYFKNNHSSDCPQDSLKPLSVLSWYFPCLDSGCFRSLNTSHLNICGFIVSLNDFKDHPFLITVHSDFLATREALLCKWAVLSLYVSYSF